MALAFSSGVPKSGMMEIGIALVLHDRFSNQAAQASSEIRNLQRDAKMAIQANLSTAYQFGSMGMQAFRTMASGVADMVRYGAEYVDTMTTVEAITTATLEQMGKMDTIAMSLGKKTMFSSQDVASGMKYLAMAGNTADEIQSMIKGATYAAGATGMALGGKGGAADVITNVMRTFQLRGEEAALMVGDVMTNATLSANISMTDLAASIRYAAADMTNLGYKLPEVSAAIGTLGNMGIQGSMAGTALANMARYLNRSISDPSYKGHKFLEQVGLTKEDLLTPQGTLKDLYSIMSIIKNATADMAPSELALFTSGVFGVRGNRAAMALLRDLEGFKSLYEDMLGTTPGYAEGIVAKRMSTVAGQLNALKSTWENLKASFTKSVSGFLIPIFKSVTTWLDGMRKILGTGFGKVLASLGLVGTALLGIGSAFLMIRSRLLLLRTDTLVSGRNMFQVLMGGWRGATIAAADYLRMCKLIQIQQTAGIMSQSGRNALMAGYTVNGIQAVAVMGRNGKPQIKYRDMNTGQWASRAAVNAAKGAGAGVLTTAVLGKGITRATSIGGKILGLGGKLLGLLGGWPGILITLAFTLIPWLISKIGGNSDAHKRSSDATSENTVAVNTLSSQYQKEEEQRKAERAANTEGELTLIANLMADIIRGQKSKTITINLNTPNGLQTVTAISEDEEDIFTMK